MSFELLSLCFRAMVDLPRPPSRPLHAASLHAARPCRRSAERGGAASQHGVARQGRHQPGDEKAIGQKDLERLPGERGERVSELADLG